MEEQSVYSLLEANSETTHQHAHAYLNSSIQSPIIEENNSPNIKPIQIEESPNPLNRHQPIISINAEIKSSTKPEQILKECRICLEGEDEGRIFRPCACSGSVTYAHEKCIIEWIKRKTDPKGAKGKLLCEMCNTPFKYKLSRRRELDCEELTTNFSKEKCNYFIFGMLWLFLLSVIMGAVVIISVCNQQSPLGEKIRTVIIKNDNIKIVFICIIFIALIALMFLIIMFIMEYGIKTTLIVSEVIGYLGTNKKKNKIFPKSHLVESQSNS